MIRLSTYLKTFRYDYPRANIEIMETEWDSDMVF